MALVTDSFSSWLCMSRLDVPLCPFERYFNELHGPTGDTAQLHIGTNSTRPSHRQACTLQRKQTANKNPSIARLNKLVVSVGLVSSCSPFAQIFRQPKQRPVIAVFLCSGWTCLTRVHQLCVAKPKNWTDHLLGMGSCPVGGYDRTNPRSGSLV